MDATGKGRVATSRTQGQVKETNMSDYMLWWEEVLDGVDLASLTISRERASTSSRAATSKSGILRFREFGVPVAIASDDNDNLVLVPRLPVSYTHLTLPTKA